MQSACYSCQVFNKFKLSRQKSKQLIFKKEVLVLLVELIRINVPLFPDRVSKSTQIPNFMKIRPVREELFHAEGQTERQT
jgi:hypothetical protein